MQKDAADQTLSEATKNKTPTPFQHELCEALFYTDDGRPWRLDEMPFFVPIYEDPANRLLLKTSRQSTKTTFIRNKLVLRSLQRPGNAAIYIAPTGQQVRDFSKKKLDTVFSYNEALKEAYVGKECDWNVHMKQFSVRGATSTVTLRSTGGHQGAERVRGNTANDIFKDEYQSLLEEHLPVIDECAATFDGRNGRPEAYFVNTGTPLSRNNPLEKEWNRSKGYEWCIHCPHCQEWNDPLGMQHLDPKKPYLFCQHCDEDPRRALTGEWRPPRGEWVATNPKGKFPGYRVVRLMMPWAKWRSKSGTGILDRLETWPEQRFANEVMGLPFDSGMQPITEAQLRACCEPYRLPNSEAEMRKVARENASWRKYAGLDWAMSAGDETPSYTKFGVFVERDGRLRLLFAHQFVGAGSSDPDYVLEKVGQWMDVFNIDLLACDYGVGYKENQRLMKNYPRRVTTMHYRGGGTGPVNTNYDPQGQKYMVPRTPSLNELFRAVEEQRFAFPEYDASRSFLEDLLRLQIEVTNRTRTVRYRPTGTDDFAHVANYALLASRLSGQPQRSSQAALGPVGVGSV